MLYNSHNVWTNQIEINLHAEFQVPRFSGVNPIQSTAVNGSQDWHSNKSCLGDLIDHFETQIKFSILIKV